MICVIRRARVDGGGHDAHKRVKQLGDVGRVVHVGQRNCSLRCKRRDDRLVFGVKGEDLAVFRCVNKLQNADYFSVVILHGDNQNGAGAISRHLVVFLSAGKIKALLGVDVGYVKKLTCERAARGDVVAVLKLAYRNGRQERLSVFGHLTVAQGFRDHDREAQRIAVAGVKRSRVTACDIHCLVKDDGQKLSGVLFRGKRHADFKKSVYIEAYHRLITIPSDAGFMFSGRRAASASSSSSVRRGSW